MHVSCPYPRVLVTESSPMQEQYLLLNAKPSLQPSNSLENCSLYPLQRAQSKKAHTFSRAEMHKHMHSLERSNQM